VKPVNDAARTATVAGCGMTKVKSCEYELARASRYEWHHWDGSRIKDLTRYKDMIRAIKDERFNSIIGTHEKYNREG